MVNEVGLDPGIDHLLAMECFDEIKLNGGKVRNFDFSIICGGVSKNDFNFMFFYELNVD